jgi:hypothetical protein
LYKVYLAIEEDDEGYTDLHGVFHTYRDAWEALYNVFLSQYNVSTPVGFWPYTKWKIECWDVTGAVNQWAK